MSAPQRAVYLSTVGGMLFFVNFLYFDMSAVLFVIANSKILLINYSLLSKLPNDEMDTFNKPGSLKFFYNTSRLGTPN